MHRSASIIINDHSVVLEFVAMDMPYTAFGKQVLAANYFRTLDIGIPNYQVEKLISLRFRHRQKALM